MLVRSWNLFHGNTVPPQRRAFLDDMLRLATADDPDVLCAQEVPAWAMGRFTIADIAKRPMFGAAVGRVLTALNHGYLRSAFSGQANALWISPRLRVLEHHVLTLNPRRFRAAKAREFRLDAAARREWAKERRVVQSVRLALEDGSTMLLANMHCTSCDDRRLADVELLRAAWFAVSGAEPGEPVVLAGDFNQEPDRSQTLTALASDEWGFSPPGPDIDHILVRGAQAGPLVRWPDERRRHEGRLLSDHAPVELEIR